MPIVRPYGAGGVAISSPPVNLRRTISLTADAQVSTTPLLVEGLPHLFLWVNQTNALANPAVLVAQWSARSVTGVGTPTDDWQTLFTAAASVIVPGTLLYLDRVLSAKRYRLQFTRVAGIATTIEVFYGGTAT